MKRINKQLKGKIKKPFMLIWGETCLQIKNWKK